MPLCEKTQFHLDRALSLAKQNGEQIWGFVLTVDEASQSGEIGKFSSHPMSDDRFIEAISSAATLLVNEDGTMPTAQA